MVIDSNIYWMPEKLFKDNNLMSRFLASIPENANAHMYQTIVPGIEKKQIVVEKPEGFQNLNYVEGQYELEVQLNDMDEAGVDKGVLKLPGSQEWIPSELMRIFNDGMAEHAERSKGRLSVLAVVPPYGTDENLNELHRCIKELGMKGVQLSAHYGDKYLDDPVFRPFFCELNSLGVPAYVHHTPLPVQYDSLLDYNNLRRSYGRCSDQITAVSRELFSGMFEELPRLKMIHSMLGGGFFTYRNLMLPKISARKEAVGRFQVDNAAVERYLQENIYFEMSHAAPWGKIQLETAIKVCGSDHILFGSSYPVRREWMLDGPGFVRSLDINDEDKTLILAGNAERVYLL